MYSKSAQIIAECWQLAMQPTRVMWFAMFAVAFNLLSFKSLKCCHFKNFTHNSVSTSLIHSTTSMLSHGLCFCKVALARKAFQKEFIILLGYYSFLALLMSLFILFYQIFTA
jgi:hypothetical protein